MQFSPSKNHQKHQVRDFLMAHADAIISGVFDLETSLEQHDQVALSQVEDLLNLAERISESLVGVTPSEQFVAQLRHQLSQATFSDSRRLWGRVRQLPPRTQLAAGIGLGGAATLTGVFLLASRRPLLGMLEGWRSRRTMTA
jgi:hypothetical protein